MDAALLYEALAGPDAWKPHAKTSLSTIRGGVKGLKIGVPKHYFFSHVEPGVRKAVLAAIGVFDRLGARILEVDLKGLEETHSIAADITAGEALAYHAPLLAAKGRFYGEDLRSRLEQARSMTALTYIRALQKKQEYAERMERALQPVDLLLAPTLPVVAPRIDEEEIRIGAWTQDVRTTLLGLTRPANLSGQPAITVPCGFSEGLPVGLQIIGRRLDESTVLRAAYAYEQATPWHEEFSE